MGREALPPPATGPNGGDVLRMPNLDLAGDCGGGERDGGGEVLPLYMNDKEANRHIASRHAAIT